jgi:plastocyanin
MRFKNLVSSLLLSTLIGLGCGGSSSTSAPASTGTGGSGGSDGGIGGKFHGDAVPDAGNGSDGSSGGGGGSTTTGAGGSGGSAGSSAGNTGTAGTAGTTGTAGSTAGTTGTAGAGSGAFMAIAPCANMTSYVTGMTAIATTAAFQYSPACLKVTAGTMVTIDASAIHPLVGLTTGSANNPIPAGPSTTPQMVTFTTPGFYPFHCNIHFSIGMAGVVWVQ